MKLSELGAKMRPYETASDRCVPPGLFLVARLDARGFTRLTAARREEFERPFDVRVRDTMIATTEHLMNSGFRVAYGYTQSDEISLLLRLDESAFGRKLRKYHSLLAGEASAKFTRLIGEVVAFDCRVAELPNLELVVDYFHWRHEDAARNALSAHAHWALLRAGASPAAASERLAGMSAPDKHELLHAHGVNFNDLPVWQRRGVGLHWEAVVRPIDPRTGEPARVPRRRIKVELELPMKDAYDAHVRELARRAADPDAPEA
jgi:tRNA(His) guanylyltransferase